MGERAAWTQACGNICQRLVDLGEHLKDESSKVALADAVLLVTEERNKVLKRFAHKPDHIEEVAYLREMLRDIKRHIQSIDEKIEERST